MSDRQFLPESEYDYAIPKRNPQGFTEGQKTLLRDVGRKMNVSLARSEGRIPSPFSRAYLFYLNLFATGFGGDNNDLSTDTGRERLQEEARRTFRGLCATFALRKALGLRIEMREVELSADGEPIERMLRPAAKSAPRNPKYWNPLRFYTVRRSADQRREVLAGQSPLTGIYPAANPPKTLQSLYWYDADSGSWYDPTSDTLDNDDALVVAEETKDVVRTLLKGWIEAAIDTIRGHGSLSAYGLTNGDETLLQKELERWKGDISVPATDRDMVDDPIPARDSPTSDALPFLNVACPNPSEAVTSDVPIVDDQLLVRKQDLLSSQKRLFGRVMGGRSFKDTVEELPREGNNLGRDLGLDEGELPSSYLFVNKLFVPKLTPLTAQGFSEKWNGIEIDGEHYLLPFRPEILNLMSPRELVERTSAELNFDEEYEIKLDFGDGAPIKQRYVETDEDKAGRYVVDTETIPLETFDLRLFPNFRLDAVSERLPEKDQRYYARVRLAPNWDFQVGPFHHDRKNGVTTDGSGDYTVERTRIGNFEETVRGDQLSRGEALFMTCEEQPDGFYLENHGLCVVDLPTPSEPKKNWEVGVDFGTSNTCVSYRPEDPGGDDSPRVRNLPVFTTTLFEEPSLNAEFENPYGSRVNERASPLLDFFYRQSQNDEVLNTQDYFPTQFITRHAQVNSSPDWDFENGLIYFRNIGIGGAIDVQELIEGYPDASGENRRTPKRDFTAKQNLKWENTEWLEAFMKHLRKHVTLAAAHENADITDLKFSYPKAFTANERSRFKNILDRSWSDLVESGDDIRLCSEAEALRNKFVDFAEAYVILDVGGGTTDVIAYYENKPIFQTSYQLAAGLVSEYVMEAPAFRRAFLEAMQTVLQERYRQILPRTLEEKFKQAGTKDSVINTIWIGLLNQIEQEDPDLHQILHELRDPASDIVSDEEAEKAVRGFFLSVTLLFTGTIFNAGILLHAASQGVLDPEREGFDPEFVNLELTGNGSKLLRMLHESEQAFDPVLKEALHHGIRAAGDQAPNFDPTNVDFEGGDRADGDHSPKVSVALGLLDENLFVPDGGSDGETLGEVPIANIVAESGYDADDIDGAGTDLISFYEKAVENDFKAGQQAPTLLTRYLEALNDMLDRGNNRGARVLPGVGADWHEALRDEVYPESRKFINRRVKRKAEKLARQRDEMSRDNIPALESLFVIELRALIEQVRTDYAG